MLTTSESWRDVLSLLMRSSSGKAKNKPKDNKSCHLLDTVFFGPDTTEWFYTTKSGAVAKKSEDSASISAIMTRFSKFALANPNNDRKLVGTLTHGNGYKQYFQAEALEDLLANNQLALRQKNSFLQVYLRPLKGKDEVLSVHYTNSAKSGSQMLPTIECHMSSTTPGVKAAVPSRLQTQVATCLEALATDLLSNRNLVLLEASLSFVVDDNEHIWLSQMSKMVSRDYSSSEDIQQYSEDAVGGRGGASPLPLIARPSSSQISSRPGSSSSQQPQLRPSSRADVGTTGTISPLRLPAQGHQMICSFIDLEADNVYRSALCVDELPGLRAWIPASGPGALTSAPLWVVDLDEYTRPLASPVDALEELREQRGRKSHIVRLSAVKTVGQCENILLGGSSCKNTTELIAAWKQSVYKENEDVDTIDEECMVCGNLYEILSKLLSLIKSDFKVASDDTLQNNRPRSVPSVVEGAFNSSRVNSAKENTHQGINLSSLDEGLDAVLPLHPLSGNPPGLKLAAPYEESKASLLARKQLADSQKTHPLVNQEVTGQMVPEKYSLDARYEQTNALYAEQQSKLIVGKKGGKGKKINDNLSQKMFKKDSMQAPPNLEIIAKFALEKEKQRNGFEVTEQQPKQQKKKTLRKDVKQVNGAGDHLGFVDDTFDFEDDISIVKHGGKINKQLKGKQYNQQQQYDNGGENQDYDRFPPLLQDISGGGYNAYLGVAGGMSVISGSEANFMLRQAESGDISQLSLMGDEGFSVLHGAAVAHTGGVDMLADTINEKMKDRVAALEKQVKALGGTIERRDEELDKAKNREMTILKELEFVKKEYAREMKMVREDKERDLLLMREAHSKEMSILLVETAGTSNQIDNITGSPSKKKNIVRQKTEGNALLLHQLDELRMEMKKLTEKNEVEKRSLQSESALKLLAQEKQSKSDLSRLRSEIAGYEDRYTIVADELNESKAQQEAIARMCQQLERSRQDALDAQGKLRADLSNMQQTMSATYRLESSQGLGVGVDADTAIRLNEAKYDAKERQLVNKVEFLKAQLSAEQESNDALKASLAVSKQKLDEFRDEFKLRMKEAEQLKRQAVEDSERRLEAQFEERMSELTALQSRVASVQQQLQESLHEQNASRQREDAARAATAKALAHQASTRAEADKLRSQVEDLRAKYEEEADKDLSKHSNEALMRRLDNERQYLKSQLASEITHKNELQTTLTQCQGQLADIQRQWKFDVDALRDLLDKSQQEAVQIEQALMAKNVNFESDNIRLSGQCKELKEAVTKMRDQLRMDQLNTENLKAANKTLQTHLDESLDDLNRLRNQNVVDADMYTQQITVLSSTIRDIEETKAKEITSLKEELSKQFAAVASDQQGILALKEKLDAKGTGSSNLLYIHQILHVLHRWKRNRLFGAFKVWSTNCTLVGVAQQFREQVDTLVVDMKAEFNVDKQMTCDELRVKLKSEEETRISQLMSDYDVLLEKTRKDLEEERILALDDAYEEFQKHLEHKETEWNELKQNLIAQGEIDLTNAITRKNFEMEELRISCLSEIENAIFEEQKRSNLAIIEAKKMTEEEWSGMLKQRMESLSEEFVKERHALTSELEEKRKKQSKLADQTLAECKLDAEQHELLELQRLRDLLLKEAAQREVQLREEYSRLEEKVRDECHDALQAARRESHEDNEKRIRLLRQQWNDDLSIALRTKDAEVDSIVQEKLAERGAMHDRELQSAVKLETAKWQQALRDAEKRYALEAKKAHSQGYEQREKELQDELNRLTISHELDKNRTVDLHKKAAAALISEHADTIIKMQNTFEATKLDELQKLERELTLKLNSEWLEKLKVKVDEAWADSASVWQTKLDRAEDKLESFKEDVSKQQQHLATERNDLLSRVSKSDELIRSIEAVKASELLNVQSDADREKRELVAKYEGNRADLIEKYEAEAKAYRESTEQNLAAEIMRMVKLERDKVTEEMEEIISKVQEEGQKTLQQMAKAASEQRLSVSKLADELAEIRNKLQEKEDELYDAQQSTKKTEKESSLSLWRMTAGVLRMKQRFAEGIQEIERKSLQEADAAAMLATRQLQNMKLSCSILSSLLVGVEASRKKVHNILVAYKTEVLIEKRTMIKALEKEIDTLTVERDGMENERDNAEDEILHMEASVGDLEEQIREHSRTSTMQNGRVNVAHARKKRRLDSELERILETIELKRSQMSDLDERVAEHTRRRDEKENELIDLEKDLVGILVEQQKIILTTLDEIRVVDEKNRTQMTVANLPYPPPHTPTLKYIQELKDTD